MVNPCELAICTIHGSSGRYSGAYARRYSWPRLQIEQLRKHTPSGYTVFAYGNRTLPEHEKFLQGCDEVQYLSSENVKNGRYGHVWPIRNWLTTQAIENHKYILHLDSDAFPIRSDWFEHYCLQLSDQCPVVAIKSEELGFTESDRAFLLFTREGYRRHFFDFSPIGVDDPGGGISQYLTHIGLNWKPLLRSNRVNYHPTIGGIYDDRVYHQGAGSRLPKWMGSSSRFRSDWFFRQRELLVQSIVMEQVFFNTDTYLQQLMGQVPPFDLDEEILRISKNSGTLSHLFLRWRSRRRYTDLTSGFRRAL